VYGRQDCPYRNQVRFTPFTSHGPTTI
jgi:hypothetical protein